MKFRTSQVRNALTDVRHVLASLKSAVETAGDLTPDSVRQEVVEGCRVFERQLWDWRTKIEQASNQDAPPAEKAK